MYINSTLIAQFIVFILLVLFTVKFIWPPIIKALDERSNKIAEGLAAAEKGKLEFLVAEEKVAKILSEGRQKVAQIIANADKKAEEITENARMNSIKEAQKILDQAKADITLELNQIRHSLVEDTVKLVIISAEKILQREIDINQHQNILDDIRRSLLNDRVGNYGKAVR